MVVVDTSVLVEVQRRAAGAVEAIKRYRDAGEPIRIPAAVWIEFLSGLPSEMIPRARRILGSVAQFEPADAHVADRAAQLQSVLLRTGRPLAWHDLHVAATALRFGEFVLTKDRAFDGVAGLAVERLD